jgi:glycosyltransferase involved in cell wall biosynthesis
MAAGLPSVVSDGPGNRDAVINGKTAIVAPVGEVELLAAGLTELAEDEQRRYDFGIAAVEVVGRYGWPRVANEYFNAFESVANDAASVASL